MTEAGPRGKAWLRAGAGAPPQPPPPGLAPPEPVDWRRGVMTLVCFFTCWLFGGPLLFAKGTTDGFGSWARWLVVVCVALCVGVGCGQPAGRLALSAVRVRPLGVVAAVLPMALYPLVGYWAAVAVLGVGGAFLLLRAARWAAAAVRARRGLD